MTSMMTPPSANVLRRGPANAYLRYGPPLSLERAKKVMSAAEREAGARDWPMVIAIVDSAGTLVMLHAREHAQHGSVSVAEGKARTAVEFKRASGLFEAALAGGGLGLRLLSMDNVVALEGGLPLVSDGCIVGAIGVSGMQSTQDVLVAQAGVDAFEPRDSAADKSCATVLACDVRRRQAMVRGETGVLEALLDAALSYTHADGRSEARDQYLGRIADGTLRYLSADVASVHAQVAGGDDAVVLLSGRFLAELVSRGERKSLCNAFQSVWTSGPAGWVMTRWMATRAAQ